VRKNLQNLTPNESDKYLTITNIRINFNNQAGLLASQSQQQLYRNSKLSGLNLSWEQFSGYNHERILELSPFLRSLQALTDTAALASPPNTIVPEQSRESSNI
jgi:hypothetical protein